MLSKNTTFKTLIIAAVFALSFQGCVKKRDDLIPQGQNLDELQAITPSGETLAQLKAKNNALQSLDLGTLEQLAGQDPERQVLADNNVWQYDTSTGSFLQRTQNSIRTSPVALKRSQNSMAEKLVIEPEVKYMNHFDVIDYTTNDPYLSNTSSIAEMLGQPNQTYGIAYEISPNFLIINKVVNDTGISSTEKTYARRVGSQWLVPVGGYTISGFFNIEKQRNDDNRTTNVVTRVPVARKDFEQATHFLIDINSFRKFARQEKVDVIPRSLLDGEWYFSKTTVEARLDRGTAVGDLGGSDSSFLSATRIIFRLQGENLIGFNTNVDEEFKEDENNLNYNTVIKIPIEQIDYLREKTGPGIMEERLDSVKKLEERRFIKLNYLLSETPVEFSAQAGEDILEMVNRIFDLLIGGLINRINAFKTLLDVTYGDNYLSFSIRDAQSGSILRYSFRKIDPTQAITPRRAFKEDNTLFGSFTTTKEKKIDYELNQKEDFEKLILMARHNPKKDIIFYFTDQTPSDQWHRDIGREAINMWNLAFRRAGLNINIRLDESKDVALGDIRYNVLNIVRRAGAGLLGFGPSLIDSETGEIVSASMNMGMDNMIEQSYHTVRSYLGRKSGRYYNFRNDQGNTTIPTLFAMFDQINKQKYYMDSTTGQFALINPIGLNATRTQLDSGAFLETEKILLAKIGLSANSTVTDLIRVVTDMKVHAYKYANLAPFFNMVFPDGSEYFSSTMVSDSILENNCPAVVALADRMATERVSTEEEIRIIDPCVRLIAQPGALTTVLHELGHNLSMRHNFIGSVDESNYPKLEDFPLAYMNVPKDIIRAMSSSIMDYTTDEGQQLGLGGYDIATVRWIYDEKVELKNGQLVKIPTDVSIEQHLSGQGGARALKPYKYCTDEHRILVTDPLCAAFDKGLNSKEVVQFQIEEVYDGLAMLYRYDRLAASEISSFVFNRATSMKNHYDKWRGFLRTQTGLNRGYLQNMNEQEYAQLIARIKADPVNGPIATQHLEVRNMIVRFLVDLAFISNKYCLVTDAQNQEKLIELEKIRQELFAFEDYSVISSCTSPSAAKYLTDRQYTFVREFGHFLDSGTFDQNPNKALDSLFLPDFAGTTSVRAVAFWFLTSRMANSIIHLREGFAPSILDEPDVREYVKTLVLDRIVNGVRIAPNDSRSLYKSGGAELFGPKDYEFLTKEKAYNNFGSESKLYVAFTGNLVNGLIMPRVFDDGRLFEMFVGRTPNPELVKNQYTNIIRLSGNYLYVQSNEGFAGMLMTRTQELEQLKGASTVSPDSLIPAKAIVVKNITPALPANDTAVTMGDVLKVIDAVNAGVQALGNNPANAATVFMLRNLFQPEAVIVQQLNGFLQQQGIDLNQLKQAIANPNASPEDKKAAQDLLNQINAISAMELYGALQAQDPSLKIPTAANLEARIDGFIVQYGQQYNYYQKNSEELEYQRSSILDILSAFSRLFQ